jgi:CHAT domain-containing protein/tetratricopeptide (TPR) repeat protein
MRSFEKPISFIFLLITSLFISKTSEAQVDEYDFLKSKYNRLSQEHKLDSALFVAKLLNNWALENEGDTSLRYAVTYRFIANSFDSEFYSDSSIFYNIKSLTVLRNQGRTNHLDYSKCLNNLGIINNQQGNLISAQRYFDEAVFIIKKCIGDDNLLYAMALSNLGLLLVDLGQYESAEEYLIKSLEIRQKNLGEESYDYTASVNNVGHLYFTSGKYKEAILYFERALQIKKILRDRNLISNNDLILAYKNLGMSLLKMGDLKSAEKQLFQAVKLTDNNQYLIRSELFQNLGVLFEFKNDFDKADSMINLAKTTITDNIGTLNKRYASVINSEGILYYKLNQLENAANCLKEAKNIYSKILGRNNSLYNNVLVNLSLVYSKQGRNNYALYNLKLASRSIRHREGIYNLNYAESLLNISYGYLLKGNYVKCEKNLLNALSLSKTLVSSGNYFEEQSKLMLASTYRKMKVYEKAELYYKDVFDIKTQKLSHNFTWLDSKERSKFWIVERDFFEELLVFYLENYANRVYSSELSFNSCIISKSLLLETSRDLDKVITNSDNEELKSQFNEMKQLRRIVSKMQSEGSDKKELMNRYIAQADSLDKILVNQLGEYATAKRKFEITWKDVQNGLSFNDAVIEFASYYDESDSTQKYIAMIVRPGYEYPRLVKIGTEPEIKEAIQMKDFSTLYNLVWQGLDSLLEGVDRVYYSPSGELNNLSFSGLYHRKDNSDSISYLLDRYELHQLTTTRYLADGTLSKQKPFEASAALLGGIDYNQVPSIDATSKGEESNEDYLLQLNLDKEIQQSRSSNFSSMMPPLKGTEIEVKTISGLLNHSGWNTTSYTGQSAGENQIKYDLLQKSPGVLHIATHGFAFPDIVKKETDLIQMNEKSSYKASEDPMVRCGLMLSGSNISWAGDPKKMIEETGDDGILTAAEVANMDLSNTKLVVLSACETGLGKIEGSEGTFGLKRAFKLAGVEQLIVSLWSVPDKETMELMTLFYTDLSLTKDPVVSFQKAQREMRYRYPYEPEKWSGFVLVR